MIGGHEPGVAGVFLDVARDERAERNDLEAFPLRHAQRSLGEEAAEAPAFVGLSTSVWVKVIRLFRRWYRRGRSGAPRAGARSGSLRHVNDLCPGQLLAYERAHAREGVEDQVARQQKRREQDRDRNRLRMAERMESAIGHSAQEGSRPDEDVPRVPAKDAAEIDPEELNASAATTSAHAFTAPTTASRRRASGTATSAPAGVLPTRRQSGARSSKPGGPSPWPTYFRSVTRYGAFGRNSSQSAPIAPSAGVRPPDLVRS